MATRLGYRDGIILRGGIPRFYRARILVFRRLQQVVSITFASWHKPTGT